MSDNRRKNAYEDGWKTFDEGGSKASNPHDPETILHDDWLDGYGDSLRNTFGNVPMSTCDKCGREFPSSRPHVIHKCVCSGGMMVPNVTNLCEEVSLDEPAARLNVTDEDRRGAASELAKLGQQVMSINTRLGHLDDSDIVQYYARERLAKMVFIDEEIEAKSPGWMTGDIVDIDLGDIEMRVLANADFIREEMRVERVARALCNDMLLSETGWRMFEDTARVLIEAMEAP